VEVAESGAEKSTG